MLKRKTTLAFLLTVLLFGGCAPLTGTIHPQVEYVETPPAPALHMVYDMRDPTPTYYEDEWLWYYNGGVWYKYRNPKYRTRTYYYPRRGIYTPKRKRLGIYRIPNVRPYAKKSIYVKPRVKRYKPILPKKTFVKPKKKKGKKKWKKR